MLFTRSEVFFDAGPGSAFGLADVDTLADIASNAINDVLRKAASFVFSSFTSQAMRWAWWLSNRRAKGTRERLAGNVNDSNSICKSSAAKKAADCTFLTFTVKWDFNECFNLSVNARLDGTIIVAMLVDVLSWVTVFLEPFMNFIDTYNAIMFIGRSV